MKSSFQSSERTFKSTEYRFKTFERTFQSFERRVITLSDTFLMRLHPFSLMATSTFQLDRFPYFSRTIHMLKPMRMYQIYSLAEYAVVWWCNLFNR